MGFVIADRVKEVTTATGTGNLTLEGALQGFRSFGSVCGDLAVVAYEVHGVDGAGAPTGEWEVGFGQWLAGGILKRVKIISSSNSNLVVTFSAGAKHVSLTVNSAQAKTARWSSLSGAINFYVRTDGDDQNSGLADTAQDAFFSLQKAVDTAVQHVEAVHGGVVYINVGSGTHAGAICASVSGNGNITIQCALPRSATLSGGGDVGTLSFSGNGARWFVYGFVLEAQGSGYGIHAEKGAVVAASTISFTNCADGHVLAEKNSVIEVTTANFFGGTSGDCLRAESGGVITCAGDITINTASTISVGGAFAASRKGLGHIDISAVGSVVSGTDMLGKRYSMAGNSVLYSNGKATTFLPGTIAGTTETGGLYL